MNTEEMANLTSSQLLLVVQEARDSAIHLGLKWAEATKKFKDLRELMPSFLAEFHMRYRKDFETVTEARTAALADKKYQEKVEEMNRAEHEARLLEVEYKAHIKTLEALSAISYVRNNELKLARHG